MPAMEWIFRWIRGFLGCSLKGGDMERFFNLCRYQGIDCWDMTYSKGVCRCCMYLDDFRKIRPFARKTRVRVRIEKRCGLAFFMVFLEKRKALWMGMGGCVFILCYLSAHIWKLEFYGNSYYTDERLAKYLSETEGIGIGTWKHQISNPELEENLRLTFPDISWVSVRKEGTSLMVALEEMVKYDSGSEEKTLPKYICASKDGEIVAMVTRGGTPKVTVGNTIKKGDVLIDGKVEIFDDSLTLTEIMNVGADGDIWAKVREDYERLYPLAEESRNYGRASWKVTVGAGDHSVSFGKNPYQDSGETYDRVSRMFYLWPGLWIQTDACRPYGNVPSLSAASVMYAEAEAELSNTIREFEEKGVQILENNVKILVYDDRVAAVGDFLLIEPVGEPSDQLPEERQMDENGETDEYNRDDG